MPHPRRRSGGTVIRLGTTPRPGATAPLASPGVPREQRIQFGGENVTEEEFRVLTGKGGTVTPKTERLRKASEEASLIGTARGEPVSAQEVPRIKSGLEQQFQEAGVFKEVTQEPIISPEQQDLGVMFRIAKSIIPKGVRKAFLALPGQEDPFDVQLEKGEEAVTQAEINFRTQLLQQAVTSEISLEIDKEIEESEEVLIQQGIPLVGVLGTVIVGTVVAQPLAQFIGTDKQIGNLEQALSLYSETLTRPAGAVVNGLSVDEAFQKLNRMEAGILLLEEQLKLAAITSPNVALSLRNAGIETRLLNLKDRLSFERTNVANRAAGIAFGEIELTRSMAFLQGLKKSRKVKGG